MDKTAIPHQLAALPNWVNWRLEKDTKHDRDAKVPYSPITGRRTSTNNPTAWGTLGQALSSLEKYSFNGVGFVFTEESGIIGIDIDHCINPDTGTLNETADDILAKLPPTYIEISPSGKGLHIFLQGALPPGGNKSAKFSVEIYGSKRYFTVTGNRYPTCVDFIAEDNGAVDFIRQKYFSKAGKTSETGEQSNFQAANHVVSQAGKLLTDDELLELAQSSKDSELFKLLWSGEWQSRYKSQSEADFALCGKLAFWSGRNEAQIDRLFRKSGLFREKWDIKHSGTGVTYGEQTVTRACENTVKCYTPPASKPDPEIFEHGGVYYRNRSQKVYPITNFLVRPTEMIVAEDESQITCDLVTVKGEVFRQTFMTSDFSNLQKFKTPLTKRPSPSASKVPKATSNR